MRFESVMKVNVTVNFSFFFILFSEVIVMQSVLEVDARRLS